MDDLISRKAAVSRISDLLMLELKGRRLPTWDEVNEAINELPSAQSEPRWIPVTECLPKNREWVLGIFQEGDTGWINPIPFICDYVGKKTLITTQDNWLLKMVDEPHPYYEKLHCIAWMPLPESYREETEDAIH